MFDEIDLVFPRPLCAFGRIKENNPNAQKKTRECQPIYIQWLRLPYTCFFLPSHPCYIDNLLLYFQVLYQTILQSKPDKFGSVF